MVSKLKPYNPRPSDLYADWHVIDAEGEVLGRLTSQIARLLMGKHKPGYVPHLLSGDFVVVVNADKVKVTGNKYQQKEYRRHSQYPGGLKLIPYSQQIERHPDRVIRNAVKGMLPKNKLAARMLKRLKVYAGPDHPHQAQVRGAEKARERRETGEV
ncbi:MAG: 50S ribosomal protein L13 [Chloroflexota bacterium]